MIFNASTKILRGFMNRTVWLGAVLALGAGLMVIALWGDWPVWLRLLLLGALALLAAAVWLVVPNAAPHHASEEVSRPPDFRRVSTGEVLLPSSAPPYIFRFSATVQWRPTSATALADPSLLAVDDVIRRARSIVTSEPPELLSLLSRQLDAALSVPQRDTSGQVEAMAQEISLTLPDEDAKRLERICELRKQEDLWENERRYQKNLRKYLGEDVFASPGSAVIWWLATQNNHVREAERLIGTLTRLSAAATGDRAMLEEILISANGGVAAAPPRDSSEEAAAHLRQLMQEADLSPDSDPGVTFIRRVAKALAAADRAEQAQAVVRHFGLDTGSQAPPPPAEDPSHDDEP
jgi:hypothetical protein